MKEKELEEVIDELLRLEEELQKQVARIKRIEIMPRILDVRKWFDDEGVTPSQTKEKKNELIQ